MSDLDFKFNVRDTVGFTIQDKDEEFAFLHGGVTPTAVLSAEAKEAILDCFRNVAWKNGSGKEHFDRLEAALNARNILSISAVYTQAGTVYDTDSLDSLKDDLVVTANYDDGTTADVTSACALSGALVEGTSTITVEFGGKTATFEVTVSVFSTTPVIQRENVVWSKTKPNTVSATGFGITKWYDYSFSQEKLESSKYWDATNGYMTTAGWTGIRVYTSDTKTYEAGHSWPASANYKNVAGKDGIYTYQFSITRNTEHLMSFARESVTVIQANGVSFSIPLSDIDDCYAYWHSTINGAIYPDGVSDGDVIFAGKNTPYYNKKNIND